MQDGSSATYDVHVDVGRPSSPGASIPPNPQRINERSCLTCHQRKVRCNKLSPCSHCTRAEILCVYPGTERNPRRPHKTTISEVSARVARLERTIAAIAQGVKLSVQPSAKVQSESDGQVQEVDTNNASKRETLVQGDETSRYFNDNLLLHVLDEEGAIRSLMGTSCRDTNDSITGSTPVKSSPLNLSGALFGTHELSGDSLILRPTRWQALLLWQTYVNNVDPVLKIFHTPTIQVAMYAAINNPDTVDKDMNALMFAIYFAATTSLSSNDAANLLEQPKVVSLKTYKRELEAALARAKLLETPNMKLLQALAIYLTCLRLYHTGRSGWILDGLVTRIAQSIGLHRDGENFRLPPFESEMRRRLWWHFCHADARATEDHGINPSSLDRSSDTKIPLNVNDSDLSPDMQELPLSRDQWTDMTHAVFKAEISNILRQVNKAPPSTANVADITTSKKALVHDLSTRLEGKYFAHCDLNAPVQRMSLAFSRLVVAKMHFSIQLQASQTDEETLLAACRIIEMYLSMTSDELLRGFAWYVRTYPQYQALIFILWHLCKKPDSPLSERAWELVEGALALLQGAEDEAVVLGSDGAKLRVLKALKERALCLRLAGGGGGSLDISAVGGDVTTDMDTFGDAGDFNEYMDFPDWSNFVDSFDLRGFPGP